MCFSVIIPFKQTQIVPLNLLHTLPTISAQCVRRCFNAFYRCEINNKICEGQAVPFIDSRTRSVIVTIQTYTVNTNIVLKANLICEFASTGAIKTKIHIHTDATVLDSMLPQPSEIWHLFCEFIMECMAIYLFTRCLSILIQQGCQDSEKSMMNKKCDVFEWLNLICFLCVIIFFLVSAYDRITGRNAQVSKYKAKERHANGAL